MMRIYEENFRREYTTRILNKKYCGERKYHCFQCGTERLGSGLMEISRNLNIAGVIMPNNWDENGRIIEVALYTNKEEVYAVEHNSIARALMNFMHRKVELKGKIKEHPDGKKSIAVHNYTVRGETVDNE